MLRAQTMELYYTITKMYKVDQCSTGNRNEQPDSHSFGLCSFWFIGRTSLDLQSKLCIEKR